MRFQTDQGGPALLCVEGYSCLTATIRVVQTSEGAFNGQMIVNRLSKICEMRRVISEKPTTRKLAGPLNTSAFISPYPVQVADYFPLLFYLPS